MRSSVEPLDDNKLKLTVEVDEDEFDKAVDAAFRKLAHDVKVPGFRPGRAPRPLLEARLGPGLARREALRDALPDFYEKALAEHDIEPVALPDFELTSGRDDGPVSFDAVVEVMPRVTVGGYGGLRVVLPVTEVGDDEVDAQVDRLREQFAELKEVGRPARGGDHVSINRRVYRNEETLQVAEDELYEVGKGTFGDELDAQLTGAQAGDILKFNSVLEAGDEDGRPQGEVPQTEVSVQVLVKQVREKVLPEVTDEWAGDASEFDTVDELRHDIRSRLDATNKLRVALTVERKVLDALGELVTEEMPEALIATEVERRTEFLTHRLGHRGVELGEYLSATGQSAAELEAELRDEAIRAIKADLALKAVVEAESIEATDADVDQRVAEMAARAGVEPPALRRRLADEGRLPAVLSDVRKAKALDWLIQHTEYVDEDGQVIERPQLEPMAEAPAEPDSAEETP